jgi:1A family penicillin-binding protein
MPIPALQSQAAWRAKALRNAINRVQGRTKTGGSQPRRRPKRPFYRSGKFWGIIFLLFLAAAAALFITIIVIARNLPNPDQLLNREVAQSTKIYDRTGQTVLYEIHGDQKRTLVKLDQLPAFVGQAAVSIEDKDFYKHGGISFWGIFRAAAGHVFFNKQGGGSTITQQFIKNAILTDEPTLIRKLKEAVLAYKLESKFSKDEILQMYLNEIPYGSNAYGVQAASRTYFGKDAKDISLPEAAVLAAITQAPSRYSPYGPNKDLLLGRQQYVLDLMQQQGYITIAQRDDAKKTEIKFLQPDTGIIAPHFVMYVKNLLAEKYGEKEIEQGGLKIYTTLDIDKQRFAEETVTGLTKDYQKKYNASNAALTAIDPKTGQILAMVGSRDYFDDSIDGQVNIATSPIQPGSSIKPLVYAALFMKGYTPNTILYDVLTNFAVSGTPYEPHDYHAKEYGPVTIRQALAGSLNIPAVKALYLAGIDNVVKLAKDMGYSTLNDPSRIGLSLVLGGGEVKLLEHTNAYSAFAREGEISPTSAILKVEDKDGKVLEEFKEKSKTVFDPKIAREINSVLSDNAARAYIFGEKNYMTLPDRPVAAKTGTTNDFKAAWTIGYTPSLVAGVWVGNNDNTAMKSGSDGSVVAAPIWNAFMKKALANTPVEQFTDPGDLITGKPIIDGQASTTVRINKQSGQLATANTPSDLIETKTIFQPHSILYYVDKNDPLGPPPANPAADPQFSLWESRVIDWAKKNNLYDTSTIALLGADSFYNPKNNPEFTITSPAPNQILDVPVLNADVDITKIMDTANVEYYINGNLLARSNSAPFTLQKDISFLNNGYHNLKVRVCDSFYNCTEKQLEFNLLVSGSAQATPSLNLTYPGSGIAVSSADFPLGIQFAYSHPEKIAALKLHLVDSAGNDQVIKTGDLTETKATGISWDEKPAAGTYKIYGELIDWSGVGRKSNKVSVVVN